MLSLQTRVTIGCPGRFGILLVSWLTFVFSVPALALDPRSDFEDGTFQGWTLPPPSVGTLGIATGGDPGYCLTATDTEPAGSPLLARAPADFTGDLSGFDFVEWDEFVVDFGPRTLRATYVLLRSLNGTLWVSPSALSTVGAWTHRRVPLVQSAWTQVSGSDSFPQVLAHVETLFLSMDTASLGAIALESKVDNVALIRPEATSVPTEYVCSWGGVRARFTRRD